MPLSDRLRLFHDEFQYSEIFLSIQCESKVAVVWILSNVVHDDTWIAAHKRSDMFTVIFWGSLIERFGEHVRAEDFKIESAGIGPREAIT